MGCAVRAWQQPPPREIKLSAPCNGKGPLSVSIQTINMKTLALLLFMALTMAAGAQITISASAGINHTAVHTRDVPGETRNWSYNSGAGQGWQGTLRAEYKLNNWIIYSGAGIEKRYFYKKYNNYDDEGIYYKPLYVTLPVGAGYNIALAKNLGLRLYGGVYVTAGIGGNFHDYLIPAWCEMSCPETPYYDGKIKYGSASLNSGSMLARVSWGGQFGAGISFLNRVELVWMYDAGLSNMLPKDYIVNNYRLLATSLDLKVNLIKFKGPKGK